MPGNLSRAKRIILSLAPFPAPIYFLVWMKPDRTPAAMAPVILAMLVYCALIILLAYRRGERPGYFDWAIAGFFAAVGVFLFAPAAALLIGRHAPTGFYLCLFAAAFLPPLGGMEPFTSQFAKKTTPPDRWDNPVFIRINLIMTYVWAGIFALGAVFSLFPSHLMKVVIPHILIIGFGFPFNAFFPDFYLKRLGLPSRAEQRGK